MLCDEGLSHNGTFVNGEHVQGRRRLVAGDVITIGGTPIVLCAADGPSSATPTLEPRKAPAAELTPAQQRVLVALSRPLLDAPHGAPASNRAIAEELVLSVDTVKNTLSALFVLLRAHRPPAERQAGRARRARARPAQRGSIRVRLLSASAVTHTERPSVAMA